jgi:hypothetical protein
VAATSVADVTAVLAGNAVLEDTRAGKPAHAVAPGGGGAGAGVGAGAGAGAGESESLHAASAPAATMKAHDKMRRRCSAGLLLGVMVCLLLSFGWI